MDNIDRVGGALRGFNGGGPQLHLENAAKGKSVGHGTDERKRGRERGREKRSVNRIERQDNFHYRFLSVEVIGFLSK